MTTEQDAAQIVRKQRGFFDSGGTQTYEFRLQSLKELRDGLRRHEEALHTALKHDLGKPEFEAYLTETGFNVHELTFTMKHLKRWMKPRRVRTPLLVQPAASRIHYSPLGVTLIIGAYNYPLGTTLLPLISAMAAGNTAIVKPSELTPASSQMLRQMIEELFRCDYIACVTGGVEETTALLRQKTDHILFTGSARVGAIVMKAAAEHLTPVTLELGGKSPCIVHEDAKLDVAVRRIASGKFLNAGQTCVAPDYVLVHRAVKEEFLEKLRQHVLKTYGQDASESPDVCRIVDDRHFRRIVSLIDPGRVVVGGQSDAATQHIAPTVMRDVTLDDPIMAEEVFGPVLPVMEYSDFKDIYHVVSALPRHPLACYIFTESKSTQKELVRTIQFGGGCINHCMQHLGNPNLPFGGVGRSGFGSYRGFSGFERFSHRKSVLKAASWIDPSLVYPPYRGKLNALRRMLK